MHVHSHRLMQAPGAPGLCRLQQWRRDAQEQVLVTVLRLLMLMLVVR